MTQQTVLYKTEDVAITYPWCFKHEAFNSGELKSIVAYCDTLEKNAARIRKEGINKDQRDYGVDSNIRRSKIAWVSYNDLAAWFFDRLMMEIGNLNKQFYNYDLWGTDILQYSTYDDVEQGMYDFHMDITLGTSYENKSHARKLSATLLLNDDFVGGEFVFNLRRENDPTPVELKAGSLIVFPSYLLHKVNPVTLGCRKSLVTWILGPSFR